MTRDQFRAAAKIWREEMGSEPSWGLLAKALRSIVDDPTFARRFRRYLQFHRGPQSRFVNLHKFAATFAQWGSDLIDHDEACRAFRAAGLPIPLKIPQGGFTERGLELAIQQEQERTMTLHLICPSCGHHFVGDDSWGPLCLACRETGVAAPLGSAPKGETTDDGEGFLDA